MNSENTSTTTTLQTLDDVFSALSEGERTTYNQIIRSIQLESKNFKKYTSWCKESYTRNCLIDTEAYELILICWGKGHSTPIHDHGGEECWVRVIEGEFEETIYQKNKNGDLELVKTSVSKEHQVTYMKDFMGFHRLTNTANKRSISLHLYAKPIRRCNMFDEKSNRFINKKLSYDTLA